MLNTQIEVLPKTSNSVQVQPVCTTNNISVTIFFIFFLRKYEQNSNYKKSISEGNRLNFSRLLSTYFLAVKRVVSVEWQGLIKVTVVVKWKWTSWQNITNGTACQFAEMIIFWIFQSDLDVRSMVLHLEVKAPSTPTLRKRKSNTVEQCYSSLWRRNGGTKYTFFAFHREMFLLIHNIC